MSEYRVCPHCCDTVSAKVYKAHERLYYNHDDKSWVTLEQLEPRVCHTGDACSTCEDLPSPPPTVSANSG